MSASSSSLSSLSSCCPWYSDSLGLSSFSFSCLPCLVRTDYVHSFEFQLDVTFLSSVSTVMLVVAAYFCVIYSTQYVVKHVVRKPFQLNGVVVLHNAMLSVGSMVLFLGLGSELYVHIRDFGLWSVFCDPEQRFTRGILYYYYYVNYIFKYIELIDTLLLALRDKPIPFLHIYHHAATLVLTWSQMWAQSCVQWVPIIINLLIHVIMYTYYSLHALGIDVWWKKYLTVCQIIQFVAALIGCFGALIPRALHSFGWTWFDYCHGTYSGAFFGIFIIASYLLLFIQFYKSTYIKARGRKVAPKSD